TSAAVTSFTLPTTSELAGNFSGIANIYDTRLPTAPQISCNGALNVICPSQIDPTAVRILSLESPPPNRPGLVNNFVAQAPIEGLQDQYNGRVDYNVTDKDRLFARYTFWNPHNGISDPLGTKVGAGPTGNTTHEGVLGI